MAVAMLIVIYAECRKQAHYAERHYGECRYAECRYAESRGATLITTYHCKTFYETVSESSQPKWTLQIFSQKIMEVDMEVDKFNYTQITDQILGKKFW